MVAFFVPKILPFIEKDRNCVAIMQRCSDILHPTRVSFIKQKDSPVYISGIHSMWIYLP